jgi:4-hydroxyacetophenone monooxygenase
MVERAWIERAVELADLDAVRMTMFHLTGDAAYDLPLAAAMSEQQKDALKLAAVDWLEANAGPRAVPAPPEPEHRRLFEMALGKRVGDLEYDMRKQLTCFEDYPYYERWPGERPALPEGFRVAVIGSGFAGIGMGVQLDLLGIPYDVFERRPEAGGVWSINRYPDVRVDTSSITYEFLFEKGHEWSEYFARGPEVRAYLDKVSRKHGVYPKTRFSHDLTKTTFDEARNLWRLEFDTPQGTLVHEANVIVSCSGLFATPNIPHFDGQEQFKGRVVHPARWPDDVKLAGKRVAVIGNGSTGIQMLGVIADEAQFAYAFQRTPQWISPRAKYGEIMEPEVAWLLKNFPAYENWWRLSALSGLFDTHELMLTDPEWQAQGGKVNKPSDAMRDDLTAYIRAQTGGREDLIARLIPDYAPFSRRPVVDNGWYRALTRDNVELVTDGIASLTENGIRTADGAERPVDVIVTATGFAVEKFLWPARYIGRNGTDLHAMWDQGDGARAYMGLMVPGFPNLFTLYGPNSQPVSGGPSQPVWFSMWGGYAARAIMRMLSEGKASVEVTSQAFEHYNAALDEEAAKLVQMTVEGGIDKNYYVSQKHNRLQVNAPWYAPDYQKMCLETRWDDLRLDGEL